MAIPHVNYAQNLKIKCTYKGIYLFLKSCSYIHIYKFIKGPIIYALAVLAFCTTTFLSHTCVFSNKLTQGPLPLACSTL